MAGNNRCPTFGSCRSQSKKQTSRGDRRKNLFSLGLGLAAFVASLTILALVRVDWSGQPFIIEHFAKAVAFLLVFSSFMAVIVAVQRQQ